MVKLFNAILNDFKDHFTCHKTSKLLRGAHFSFIRLDLPREHVLGAERRSLLISAQPPSSTHHACVPEYDIVCLLDELCSGPG
jgi:hypothetical protein